MNQSDRATLSHERDTLNDTRQLSGQDRPLSEATGETTIPQLGRECLIQERNVTRDISSLPGREVVNPQGTLQAVGEKTTPALTNQRLLDSTDDKTTLRQPSSEEERDRINTGADKAFPHTGQSLTKKSTLTARYSGDFVKQKRPQDRPLAGAQTTSHSRKTAIQAKQKADKKTAMQAKQKADRKTANEATSHSSQCFNPHRSLTGVDWPIPDRRQQLTQDTSTTDTGNRFDTHDSRQLSNQERSLTTTGVSQNHLSNQERPLSGNHSERATTQNRHIRDRVPSNNGQLYRNTYSAINTNMEDISHNTQCSRQHRRLSGDSDNRTIFTSYHLLNRATRIMHMANVPVQHGKKITMPINFLHQYANY